MFKEINVLNGNYIDNDNVKQLSPELREVWNEMFTCRAKIELILRSKPSMAGKGYLGFATDVPIAAYLLAKVSDLNNPFDVDFEILESLKIEPSIIELARKNEINQSWKELLELIKDYKQNIFCLVAILKDLSEPMVTPESITVLAEELLGINENDSFADFCCGTGSVARTIKRDIPEAVVTGYDINEDAIAMAKIYENLSETEIAFEKKDIFELALAEKKTKFTKIFANYPFGMRMRDLMAGKEYLEQLAKRIPSMSKATSSDWLYNMLMVDLLTEDGKAIGLMTNGSTWNMIDAPIRKYFVESGLIECVIALPSKLFSSTNIATSMIVFSHNNKGVRLVDASDLFVAGRRVNELNDENIDAIISALKEDSEISMFIEVAKLRDNDYVLSTSRYANVAEDIEDGKTFETVIKRITRGAPLNAKDLDKISSPIPTNMQYLMLANIQNGLIDTNLPYISGIEKKNEKYCLSNHCLILSKNGYPYKIAVAEVMEGQKIMANGNLYIIELDEEQVNPYYLAAFFGSEQGTAALKSITVGATIPNIGVEQLKKLIIPIPELSKQKEIADRYQTVKDEIIMLQLKLDKAKNRMAHIYEEGGDK